MQKKVSSKMDFSQLYSPKRPNMLREIEHKYHTVDVPHMIFFQNFFFFLFSHSMNGFHAVWPFFLSLFLQCASFCVCMYRVLGMRSHITIYHVSFLSICILSYYFHFGRMLDLESICKLCVCGILYSFTLGIDEM